MAVVTDVPENPKLSCLTLAKHPYYVAMMADDPLAANKEIRMKDLDERNWALLSRRVSPYLHEMIQTAAIGGRCEARGCASCDDSGASHVHDLPS